MSNGENTTFENKKITQEPDFLKQYRRCYPRAKKFHVTSDGLVFPDDKKAAEAHQRCIGCGELRTY
jgi:hypothetical protein